MLLLLIATIAGALTASGLGWAEAGGAFNARKFIPSAIRAAIAAVLMLLGTTYLMNGQPVTLLLYVLAFMTGMGVDAGGNRLAGAILPKKT